MNDFLLLIHFQVINLLINPGRLVLSLERQLLYCRKPNEDTI